MKVIDAHVHLIQCVAGTGSGGELRYCDQGDGMARYANGTLVQLLPKEFGDGRVTPEQVLQIMDENDVEKAVLLQGNYYGFQNLYSYDAMQKYPDRFLAAASYDPFSRDVSGIRKYLFEELKIPVVKFEVSTGSGLMCNHEFRLDGEMMEDCYSYAEQQKQVFVIDIGKCGSESWQVQELRTAILRHPEMKFVVCHLLACSQADRDRLEAGLRLLKLPNVWFDLAAVTHNCRPDSYPYPKSLEFLQIAKNIVGADRLMFGTDLPSALKRDTYKHYIEMITEADMLTAREKECILHDTAEEVFFRR